MPKKDSVKNDDDLSKLKFEEMNLNIQPIFCQEMLNRSQTKINSGLKLKGLDRIQCG